MRPVRLPLFRVSLALGLCAALLPLPAAARGGQMGGWGGMGGGWDSGPWGPSPLSRARPSSAESNEGRVTVARFVTEGTAAEALGKGTVMVTGAPTGSGVESRELATYEAAVIDQLAQLGYRTDAPETGAQQVAELHIGHETVAPEEVKKPVSGEATVGVSNRGSMMGLALAVDLSKPKGALIATRLEARIRDKASGAVLWEGRADVITREGSDKWTEGAIANRLAAALFDSFPGGGESRL